MSRGPAYRTDIHDRIVARVRARADEERARETPQEDIRNALAILDSARFLGGDPLLVSYAVRDLEAIERRLWSAVRKLESGTPKARTE